MDTRVHWLRIKTEDPADSFLVEKIINNCTAPEAIDTALDAAGIPISSIEAMPANMTGTAIEVQVVRHPEQRFVTTDCALAKVNINQFLQCGWKVKVSMVSFRGGSALPCCMSVRELIGGEIVDNPNVEEV